MLATHAKRSIWWPALVALGVLCATTAQAAVISDGHLGFTLTLPEGFADYPPARQQPGTLYAYIKGQPGSEDFVILAINPMGGTIGRESLAASALPQAEGIKFDVRREKWKSFEIDVMVGTAQQGSGVAILIAQVPLKREAIQLALTAPAARQAELLALLRSLLASLDGRSNWLTAGERAVSAGKALGGVAVLLGLVGWLIWGRRKRRDDPAPVAGAPDTTPR